MIIRQKKPVSPWAVLKRNLNWTGPKMVIGLDIQAILFTKNRNFVPV
jgi:hypothetical protein